MKLLRYVLVIDWKTFIFLNIATMEHKSKRNSAILTNSYSNGQSFEIFLPPIIRFAHA